MKDSFKLFSMALCACAFAACSDDNGDGGDGGLGDKSAIQYVVMSGTADGTANYLQLTSDPTKGTIDPTNKNGRMSFDASNPDFVNYNNEILIGMNYPSKGGTAGPSQAWKLVDGQLVEHGSRLQLDGDVKARCFFNDYLLGLSDQATDNDHTSRVKFIKVSDFSSVTTNGVLDCDDSSKEPASQMTSQYGNEAWGVGDMAQYGDYVLLAYTTKHTVQDNNNQRAKASYGTDLDKNFYLGVYKFDPTDANKEYLKFQNMIIRKSEDHVGQEAGQIKGNSRSRTETGIEVVGDNIYLFCQGGKNFRTGNMEVPSAVLRISGSNIQSGKPVAIDNDYYVNLNDKTGNRYLWRCYYLGDNKFCLQLFTNPGQEGYNEGTHLTFGIFDVETTDYTPVTGMPAATDVVDIALACATDTSNGTVTFEVQPTAGANLYTINRNGQATKGTTVEAETIKGVSLLYQK